MIYNIKTNIKDKVEVYAKGDVASFFVIGDWGGMPVFPFRYGLNLG